MWRQVVYVFIGIVALNLVLMAVMFVQAQDGSAGEDECDQDERGLVILSGESERGRDRWVQVLSPDEPTDLPPCKGRTITRTQLKITAS